MKIVSVAVALLIPAGFIAPTAINAAPDTTKQIKVKQVKKHDTSTDCWSIVNRKVYNLTGWISKHPGGFNAQHASAKAPTFNLSKYQIGVVKKKKKR
jgi:hypothetical protein